MTELQRFFSAYGQAQEEATVATLIKLYDVGLINCKSNDRMSDLTNILTQHLHFSADQIQEYETCLEKPFNQPLTEQQRDKR